MTTMKLSPEEYLMLKSICNRYEEINKVEDGLNVKIIDYPFSVRTKNILSWYVDENKEVITLKDLKNKLNCDGFHTLLRYRLCGKKTLEEVKTVLLIG